MTPSKHIRQEIVFRLLKWFLRSYSGAVSVRVSRLVYHKNKIPAVPGFLICLVSMLTLDGLGIAARAWQLGLEMRPFFNKESLWAYPVFAGAGASFGYWLQGVDERQQQILGARKKSLLEKRARRAEREAAEAAA